MAGSVEPRERQPTGDVSTLEQSSETISHLCDGRYGGCKSGAGQSEGQGQGSELHVGVLNGVWECRVENTFMSSNCVPL